jgi:hypothetical protein
LSTNATFTGQLVFGLDALVLAELELPELAELLELLDPQAASVMLAAAIDKRGTVARNTP